MNEVMYKSENQNWETPDALFNKLDAYYHFDIDVCASDSNHKCTKYWTEEDDCFTKTWEGTCWMNPPYGRGIGKFMRYALEQSRLGCTVVCLVETVWFIVDRLRFKGAKTGAPFPSAFIVFRNHEGGPKFGFYEQ